MPPFFQKFRPPIGIGGVGSVPDDYHNTLRNGTIFRGPNCKGAARAARLAVKRALKRARPTAEPNLVPLSPENLVPLSPENPAAHAAASTPATPTTPQAGLGEEEDHTVAGALDDDDDESFHHPGSLGAQEMDVDNYSNDTLFVQEEMDVDMDIMEEEKPVKRVPNYDVPSPAPLGLDTTPVRGYVGSLLVAYNPLRIARIQRHHPERVAPNRRFALPMPLPGVDKIRQMYEPRYRDSFWGKHSAAENLALSVSGNRAVASARNRKAIIMETDAGVRWETPCENCQSNDWDCLGCSDHARELLPSMTGQNGNSCAPCIHLGARCIPGVVRVPATPRGVIRRCGSEDSN